MRNNKIPIIFAVTGHMDISTKAIKPIKKIIKNIFVDFKEKYPHTPAVLISALAEGADMLVAEVALECGLELNVMLPYEEKSYLNFFKNPDNIQTFKKLKSKASKVEVVTDINIHSAEESYEILGEKLADVSTILIALWDGKDNGKKGGTSEVVKYKAKIFANNKKDRHIGSAIYIITTPRENTAYSEKTIQLKKQFIGPHINEKEFENILKKIDLLNIEIEESSEKSLSYLHSIMNFFEKRASINQKRFKLYSKLILLISAFAIISLEFFHDFGADISLIFYGLSIIIAFFIYYLFLKKGDVQNNFVYSRGFVEALRVQNIWNAVNLNISVSNYYLVNQHYKYAWIRIALRNITYIDKIPFNKTENNKKFIPEYWIKEQMEYYKNAIMIRDKSFSFWEKTEKFFYITGLIFLVIMFIYYFAEKSFELHNHFILHLFIFLSGITLLIAVLIGEQYMQLEGFEEEIYNFEVMYNLFSNTKEALNKVSKNSNEYKNIIKDLGIAALEENTKWVVLHDKNKVKPILE